MQLFLVLIILAEGVDQGVHQTVPAQSILTIAHIKVLLEAVLLRDVSPVCLPDQYLCEYSEEPPQHLGVNIKLWRVLERRDQDGMVLGELIKMFAPGSHCE